MMVGAHTNPAQAHAFRLFPGQDLRRELLLYADNASITASAIVSCVGSLREVALRLADESLPAPFEGPFEIVSVTGTLGQSQCHLHISVAGADGHVIGGHLREGSIIHTTAEVILMVLPTLVFAREMDDSTGFKELIVQSR